MQSAIIGTLQISSSWITRNSTEHQVVIEPQETPISIFLYSLNMVYFFLMEPIRNGIYETVCVKPINFAFVTFSVDNCFRRKWWVSWVFRNPLLNSLLKWSIIPQGFIGGTIFFNCIFNDYFYLIGNTIVHSFVDDNGFTSTINTPSLKAILKPENVVATR